MLAAIGGEPVVERLGFERNGRSHQHDRWEHVRVLKGEGAIIFGDRRVLVRTGDSCSIPPQTDHWMETDSGMELVLLYGGSSANERDVT